MKWGRALGASFGLILVTAFVLPTFMAFAQTIESKAEAIGRDLNIYEVTAKSSKTEVKEFIIYPTDDCFFTLTFSDSGEVELTLPITDVATFGLWIYETGFIPFTIITSDAKSTTIKFTVPEVAKNEKIVGKNCTMWPARKATIPPGESEVKFVDLDGKIYIATVKSTDTILIMWTIDFGGCKDTGAWLYFSKSPGNVELTLPVTGITNVYADNVQTVSSDAKSTTIKFTVPPQQYSIRINFCDAWPSSPAPAPSPKPAPTAPVQSEAEYTDERDGKTYKATARSTATKITEFFVAPDDDCYLSMTFSKPGPVELTLPMIDMTNFRIWEHMGDSIPFKIVSSAAKSTTITFTVPDNLGIGGSGCGNDGTTMWPYKVEKVGPALSFSEAVAKDHDGKIYKATLSSTTGIALEEFFVAPDDDCYLEAKFSKPGEVELTLPMSDMTNFKINGGNIPFKIVSSDAKSTTISFTVPDKLRIVGWGCGNDGTTMWPTGEVRLGTPLFSSQAQDLYFGIIYQVTGSSESVAIVSVLADPCGNNLRVQVSGSGEVMMTVPLTRINKIWPTAIDNPKQGNIPFKIVSSDAKSTTISFTVPAGGVIPAGSMGGYMGAGMFINFDGTTSPGCPPLPDIIPVPESELLLFEEDQKLINLAMKLKKKIILIAVKNNDNIPIFSCKLNIDDGDIRYAKARGWDRERVDQSTVIVKTNERPIMPGQSLIILLISDKRGGYLEWTALGKDGNVISGGFNVMSDGAGKSREAKVLKTVKVGTDPRAIDVNPKTNMIYVANTSDNSLSVIDGNKNEVIKRVDLGHGTEVEQPYLYWLFGSITKETKNKPIGVAVNPDTNKIYVTTGDAATVVVVDGKTYATEKSGYMGLKTGGVAVNPNTNIVYVAKSHSFLSLMDGSTKGFATANFFNDYSGDIERGVEVAVNPETNKIYVTSTYNDRIVVLEHGAKLEIYEGEIYGGINHNVYAVGRSPTAIDVNPKTNTVYVTNSWDDTVSILNFNTDKMVTVKVGKNPIGVAVNPETNKIYVANNGDNTISVIDGYTDTVIQTVKVGKEPLDVAVNPNTNKIYVANWGDDTVSVISGAN